MKVYTISGLGVESHEVIRETATGWTVFANWSNCGATKHIKECRCVSISRLNPDNTYTATNKESALYIAKEIRSVLELRLRDLESSIMRFEGE